MTGERLPVECGACGWTGKRKAGNLVFCPKCKSPAGFQSPSPPLAATQSKPLPEHPIFPNCRMEGNE